MTTVEDQMDVGFLRPLNADANPPLTDVGQMADLDNGAGCTPQLQEYTPPKPDKRRPIGLRWVNARGDKGPEERTGQRNRSRVKPKCKNVVTAEMARS
jgi:hypothetical protein